MIVAALQIHSRGSDGVSSLAALIEKVPELQEKKKRIDMNMSLATALLGHLKVFVI